MRQDYQQGYLLESEAHADPMLQFDQWFVEAEKAEVYEPNAMSLATSMNGQPSIRIVLLKGYDAQGFTFFTNYLSDKGKALAVNPKASLNFFWKEIERQIRIEGMVEKLPAEASDAYFMSRDRGSRIGAWASPQSQEIADRSVLEGKVAELLTQFEGKEVTRPPHWGGYLLRPHRVEFWQGRKSRLHDRLVYERIENGELRIENEGPMGEWKMVRLAP